MGKALCQEINLQNLKMVPNPKKVGNSLNHRGCTPCHPGEWIWNLAIWEDSRFFGKTAKLTPPLQINVFGTWGIGNSLRNELRTVGLIKSD
jgi:hypothetical protein